MSLTRKAGGKMGSWELSGGRNLLLSNSSEESCNEYLKIKINIDKTNKNAY